MQKIILKKKSVTKTNNNSFNIVVANKAKSKPIGNYNQDTGVLLLDLNSFLTLISEGVSFSYSFKRILLTATGGFVCKKTLKIKF